MLFTCDVKNIIVLDNFVSYIYSYFKHILHVCRIVQAHRLPRIAAKMNREHDGDSAIPMKYWRVSGIYIVGCSVEQTGRNSRIN